MDSEDDGKAAQAQVSGELKAQGDDATTQMQLDDSAVNGDDAVKA